MSEVEISIQAWHLFNLVKNQTAGKGAIVFVMRGQFPMWVQATIDRGLNLNEDKRSGAISGSIGQELIDKGLCFLDTSRNMPQLKLVKQ